MAKKRTPSQMLSTHPCRWPQVWFRRRPRITSPESRGSKRDAAITCLAGSDVSDEDFDIPELTPLEKVGGLLLKPTMILFASIPLDQQPIFIFTVRFVSSVEVFFFAYKCPYALSWTGSMNGNTACWACLRRRHFSYGGSSFLAISWRMAASISACWRAGAKR